MDPVVPIFLPLLELRLHRLLSEALAKLCRKGPTGAPKGAIILRAIASWSVTAVWRGSDAQVCNTSGLVEVRMESNVETIILKLA